MRGMSPFVIKHLSEGVTVIAVGCGAIAFGCFDREGLPSLRLLAMASALPLIVAGLFVSIGRPRLGTYVGVALFAAFTIYVLAAKTGSLGMVLRLASYVGVTVLAILIAKKMRP